MVGCRDLSVKFNITHVLCEGRIDDPEEELHDFILP